MQLEMYKFVFTLQFKLNITLQFKLNIKAI